MRTFGERLKEARVKAGISQQQVSNAARISIATYQRYEAGTKVPDLIRLQRLADALQVPQAVLLGEGSVEQEAA